MIQLFKHSVHIFISVITFLRDRIRNMNGYHFYSLILKEQITAIKLQFNTS